MTSVASRTALLPKAVWPGLAVTACYLTYIFASMGTSGNPKGVDRIVHRAYSDHLQFLFSIEDAFVYAFCSCGDYNDFTRQFACG